MHNAFLFENVFNLKISALNQKKNENFDKSAFKNLSVKTPTQIILKFDNSIANLN